MAPASDCGPRVPRVPAARVGGRRLPPGRRPTGWRHSHSRRAVATATTGRGAGAPVGRAHHRGHAADLQTLLSMRYPVMPYRLDADAVSVRQTNDGVTVRFENGQEATGDVVVGADGLRSVVARSSSTLGRPGIGGTPRGAALPGPVRLPTSIRRPSSGAGASGSVCCPFATGGSPGTRRRTHPRAASTCPERWPPCASASTVGRRRFPRSWPPHPKPPSRRTTSTTGRRPGDGWWDAPRCWVTPRTR